MSGFSSAVNTMAGGVKSYKDGVEKKKQKAKEDAQYELLMQKKQQELTMNDQTIDMNDKKLKQVDYKLDDLRNASLKQSIDLTKKDFTEKFNTFVSTYKQHQGTLAKVNPDGTKEYTIPTDMKLAVKDMNNVVVHDPVGADWINHFMDKTYGTLKNPIVNMDYSPESDELVLIQKSGKEIKMSPALMYNAMGLQKYSTFRHTKEVEDLAKKSKILYENNKASLEETKVKTSLQDSNTKRFDAETKRLKVKADIDKQLHPQKKDKSLKESIHDKLANWHKISAEALENPSITKKDVKPLVDKLKSDKDFTDTLKKDGIYDKVNKLKYFSTKSSEFSKELSSLEDGVKTGSFETVNKMFIKYTGKGVNKEEYIKATDLSTRMNLLIMDYLQYKSGAAFGKEELAGYQAAGGILDFTTDDMAKTSLKGMAKYLKNKLSLDIKAVPNANQRLVLEYDADILPSESPMQKLTSLKTRDEQKKYLKDLKETNPSAYEALRKELAGE